MKSGQRIWDVVLSRGELKGDLLSMACDPNLCAAARVEQRPTTVAEAGAFPFLAGSDMEARQVLWALRLIGSFGARVRNQGDRHFVHAFRQDVGALFH
jgi:hypothetical protein